MSDLPHVLSISPQIVFLYDVSCGLYPLHLYLRSVNLTSSVISFLSILTNNLLIIPPQTK